MSMHLFYLFFWLVFLYSYAVQQLTRFILMILKRGVMNQSAPVSPVVTNQ